MSKSQQNEQTVHIALGKHSYDIVIGHNLDIGALSKSALPQVHDLLIVSNDVVAPLYLNEVTAALQKQGFNVASCILKDGECYKNIDSYMQIMTSLLENGFGRDCALVALGGGVVGDMTGFAAATFQRGVKFIQIPTTLLALVDSSVGGKTAINHALGKNMIGAFHQPKLVIADLNFLKTLPEREFAAGMAEVIKYGVILDADFFRYLAVGKDKLDLQYVVKRCCELKAHVVSQDEKERGMRALLNYGHTFGHAIEVGCGFGNYLHGEAVAIGMLIAAYVGYKVQQQDNTVFKDILSLLKLYHLPFLIPERLSGKDFIAHMRHDKKVKAGHIHYIIPERMGSALIRNDISDDEIIKLIDRLKENQHKHEESARHPLRLDKE